MIFTAIGSGWRTKKREDSSPTIDDNANEDLSPTKGGKESYENAASGGVSLEWRDYVALVIASLETILLPLVIFIAVVIAILFILPFFT